MTTELKQREIDIPLSVTVKRIVNKNVKSDCVGGNSNGNKW